MKIKKFYILREYDDDMLESVLHIEIEEATHISCYLTPKIFISHPSVNREIVDAAIEYALQESIIDSIRSKLFSHHEFSRSNNTNLNSVQRQEFKSVMDKIMNKG